MFSALKKFTTKLLKTKPDYWTTRLPWVIVVAAVVHVILGLIVFLSENDVRYNTQYEIWASFIFIIGLLALVFYLIFLLRFNVFKRFGKLSKFHYVGTFLAFFTTIALVVSWGYNPSAVTAIRARTAFNETKIAKDINRINLLLNTLEYDSIPHKWTRQKVVLENDSRETTYFEDQDFSNANTEYDNVSDAAAEAVEAASDVSSYNETASYYVDSRVSHMDSLQFFSCLKKDSVIKITDTSFYRFYAADYAYVTDYHSFFAHTNVAEMDKEDLFDAAVKTKPIITNRPALEAELKNLIKKYWAYDHGYYQYDEDYYNDNEVAAKPSFNLPYDFNAYVNHKYRIYDLDEGISNISNRYYMWDLDKLGFIIYPMYYISLILSIILFLFRHNRKKSFFYTILAGVILFILSATLIAISRGGEDFSLGLMLFYIILFGAVAFSISKASKKTLLQDIGMNLFIFFTPMIPMLLAAIYYQIKETNFNATHNMQAANYSKLYAEAFKLQDMVMEWSQVAGFLLFILLLHFVFSKLLRKSYALPEN